MTVFTDVTFTQTAGDIWPHIGELRIDRDVITLEGCDHFKYFNTTNPTYTKKVVVHDTKSVSLTRIRLLQYIKIERLFGAALYIRNASYRGLGGFGANQKILQMLETINFNRCERLADAEKQKIEDLKSVLPVQRQETYKNLFANPKQDLWGTQLIILKKALDSNHKDVVEALIQHGCNIRDSLPGWVGGLSLPSTALHISCRKGHLGMIQILCHQDIINTTDQTGLTPLCIACDRGDINIANCLMDNGAKPDLRDGRGSLPIVCAIASGNLDLVKNLEQRGVAITPDLMHLASRCGTLAIVRYIVDKGLDVNIKDTEGLTVLDHASDEQIAHFLMDHGAEKTQNCIVM